MTETVPVYPGTTEVHRYYRWIAACCELLALPPCDWEDLIGDPTWFARFDAGQSAELAVAEHQRAAVPSYALH